PGGWASARQSTSPTFSLAGVAPEAALSVIHGASGFVLAVQLSGAGLVEETEMVWAGGMGPAATVRMTTVAGEAVRVCECRNGVPTKSNNTPRRAAEDRHAIAIPDF